MLIEIVDHKGNWCLVPISRIDKIIDFIDTGTFGNYPVKSTCIMDMEMYGVRENYDTIKKALNITR